MQVKEEIKKNGYMLHKKKPLTIKIKQKHITYVFLLLNTAIISIFKP